MTAAAAGPEPGAAGRRLFGTDGVRGVANRELTPELALALGRALGGRLEPGASVLVGRDTRRSGPMLEAALAAGLASAGLDVALGGVLPTPAVAELVPELGASAGAVISASHNPFPDNGIKLFGPDGFKLPDADEAAIEDALGEPGPRPEAAGVGSIDAWPQARERYVSALLRRFPVDLAGLSIAVDCAHGATVVTAPEVLERLGARLEVSGARPDGLNINVGCGSTDLRALREAVVAGGHHLGLAFDGDGDRVLAVDAAGAAVDGDQILAILALDMRDRGTLAGGGVVTTTMTNLGFRRAMAAAGIEVRWTDVGDRYVLEGMRDGGFVLGGEPSGHLINLGSGPTGDGLATALQLLAALVRTGRALAEAAAVVQHLPQRLVTVPVARKADLAGAEAVWVAVRACERELGEDGRVVVRASGTEPAVRVMVEAPTADTCERLCADIVHAVVESLGSVQ
ncbi:MAG: phosphoglucosamine mutase [Miltoncostaeaceae bacterium]|jgi:phosphoglucosamine mutase|nr:phosphoglucosamine mutase [Miltoncostaeaceae bacterium]